MRWGVLVVVAGCRINFDPVITTATPDAMPDAVGTGADADPSVRVIVISTVPHHIGDSVHSNGVPPDPEGPTWSAPFDVTPPCSTSTLRIIFTGPYGPSVTSPPIVAINGTSLGSVIPFFPGCDANNCDDFSAGPVLAALDSTAAVMLATNMVEIADTIPSDDFYFRNVELHCKP